MRSSEAGHVAVWMLLLVMLGLAAALGVAQVGTACGNNMRRQVTADAALLTAVEVLAERMRHIARLQRIGQEAWLQEDETSANKAATAARGIALATFEVVRREALIVAIQNGTKFCEIDGLQNWFIEIDSGGVGPRWIGLAPGMQDQRLTLRIRQTTGAWEIHFAASSGWIDSPSGIWDGPLVQDDWIGVRIGP